MSERAGFYRRTLESLLADGVLARDDRILVVAGGEADREAFAGFPSVTITNVSPEEGEEFQDAEALTYEDGSFDFAVVSAGLHHCRSPHRAVLELYRVARKGLLAVEARDSLLMRATIRAGVTPDYELTAVAAHDFRSGGVGNTATPNYVYRWTEREVEKTIRSAAPHAHHRFLWFHEFELPFSVVRGPWAVVARVANPVLTAFTKVLPSQANLFAFAVVKTGELQPWMRDPETPDEQEIRRLLA